MNSKIDYLKKYNKSVKILSKEEINNINKNIVPTIWIEALLEENIKEKIKKILHIWDDYVEKELSNTLSYLNKYTHNIEMLNIDNRYSLLYSIKNKKGGDMYYEGRNPLDEFNNDGLKIFWEKSPEKLRGFYNNVHNGFYYYASESMGLVSIESVTFLDNYEWGIIEELEEPLGVDLKTSFGFFSNGMGDYVVIDYKNCSNDNATVWFHNDQPTYNANFWDEVDEWITIGFGG